MRSTFSTKGSSPILNCQDFGNMYILLLLVFWFTYLLTPSVQRVTTSTSNIYSFPLLILFGIPWFNPVYLVIQSREREREREKRRYRYMYIIYIISLLLSITTQIHTSIYLSIYLTYVYIEDQDNWLFWIFVTLEVSLSLYVMGLGPKITVKSYFLQSWVTYLPIKMTIPSYIFLLDIIVSDSSTTFFFVNFYTVGTPSFSVNRWEFLSTVYQ